MVKDPRINQWEKFPLEYIPTTVFTATISACSYWREIEDYAEEYQDDLEELYELYLKSRVPGEFPFTTRSIVQSGCLVLSRESKSIKPF